MNAVTMNYEIFVNGVLIKHKTFKKTSVFKGHKLHTRTGWVSYLYINKDGKKIELFSNP